MADNEHQRISIKNKSRINHEPMINWKNQKASENDCAEPIIFYFF